MSYSILFDGSGDYLSIPDHNNLDLGTSDFTIEFWLKAISLANSPFIFDKTTGNGSDVGWWVEVATNAIYFGYGTMAPGTQFAVWNSGFTLGTGSWKHIALTRSGTTLKAFVDGTALADRTVTNADIAHDNISPVIIGGWNNYSSSYNLNGRISNFRIVKGSRVYTASFTPSTTPLTAITNTQLLLCQSATIIDNSSNNFTVTALGNSAVSSDSPFPAATPTFIPKTMVVC